MFSNEGFNGTSVFDVAASVGVTNAGLHYHFETKQALLLRVLETGMDGFLPRLEEISAMDASAREKMEQALLNHLDFVLHRTDAVKVFIRERRFLREPLSAPYQQKVDRYDELFRQILADGVDSGEFPPVDVGVTSMLILGAINSIAEWRKPKGRLSDAELTGVVLDLILERLLAVRP
jgi:AcrR family transcriptional regulator